MKTLAQAQRLAGKRRRKTRATLPMTFVRAETSFYADRLVAVYPISLISEANQRGHWRAHRERHKQHRWVGARVMHLCRLDKAAIKRVVITRLAPRLLDSDNATGSAKSLRDGIADWIGRGDGPTCGIEWIVQQEKSAAIGVRIEVFT